MQKLTKTITITLALTGLLLGSRVMAQASTAPRSNTQGVALGVHLNGSSLAFDGQKSESGGGIGLMIGYGFTKNFMLFLGGDAAKVDIKDPDFEGSFVLAHGDLGARYTFANASRAWVPYLQGGFTMRTASAEVQVGNGDTEVSISGPAFSLGGGVQYFFTPKVALDLGLLFSSGKFNEIKVGNVSVKNDDAETSNSTRVNVGLKFYLQSTK